MSDKADVILVLIMLMTQHVADDIKGETFDDAHKVLRCAAEGPCPVCYHLQKCCIRHSVLGD